MRLTLAIAALLCLLLPFTLYAQKDAPVAGHAATLTDFLKKDYNTIDPTLRREQITNDRSLVISIFKSYVTRSQQDKLYQSPPAALSKAIDSANTFLSRLNKWKVLAGSTVSGVRPDQLQDNIINDEKNYYNHRYTADDLQLEQLIGIYKDNNNFLSEMASTFRSKYASLQEGNPDRYAAVNSSAAIQKSIPFFGGSLTFETVIDGLSRFIAKRIKEELTTYMITRLQAWLSDPSETDPLAEFKVLLPRTTAYLRSFDGNGINNFVNEVKGYIEDDLNHTLENAVNLRNTPRLRLVLEKYPDLDFAFEALELVPAISKVKYVPDYFTFLETSRNISRWKDETTNTVKYNIANAVYLTGLLSRSLVVIENGEPRFAGADFLTTYGMENSFFMLYAGFLHQQNLKYYGLEFKTPQGDWILANQFGELVKINETHVKFNSFRNFLVNSLSKISRDAEKIFVMGADIRRANKDGQKIGADTIFSFIDAVINFSEAMTINGDGIRKRLSADFSTAANDTFSFVRLTESYFKVARTTNEVIRDIRQKRYTNGLIKAIEIATSLNGDQNLARFARIGNAFISEQLNKHTVAWQKLVPLINTSRAVVLSLDSAAKAAAGVVVTDLGRLDVFYRANYEKQPLLKNIRFTRSTIENAITTGSFSVRDLDTLKKVLTNDDFRDLVLGYFLKVNLQKVYDELKSSMKSEITRLGVKEFKVFTDEDYTNLESRLMEYGEEAYKLYFLGTSTSATSLDQKRARVQAILQDYMALLPSRLEGRVDPTIVSLAQFVSDMAVSKDAADVERAIEAFALPSGSFTTKRRSSSNWSVNCYPGILVGGEFSYKPEQKVKSWTIGFTAPIGISWSKKTSKGGSVGFFASLIDIGAVTRLRLDDNNATTSLPDFKLKNILAPGIYFSYGFPKTPFSINLGTQYGPDLKEIQTDGSAKFYESVRVGVGFVLDIPLLTLHNKRDR